MNLPLQAREQTSEYGMETIHAPSQKEVLISINSGNSYPHSIQGYAGNNPRALSGKECDNQQCTLQ